MSPPHQNFKLFFDNWCCGTVQARRLPGLRFKSDSDLKHEGRGSKDVWKANVESTTVAAVKWQDTKSVCMASTFLSHKPNGSRRRYNKKEKSTIKIARLNLVKVYNQNIGRVDLQDQMIALYRMAFR